MSALARTGQLARRTGHSLRQRERTARLIPATRWARPHSTHRNDDLRLPGAKAATCCSWVWPASTSRTKAIRNQRMDMTDNASNADQPALHRPLRLGPAAARLAATWVRHAMDMGPTVSTASACRCSARPPPRHGVQASGALGDESVLSQSAPNARPTCCSTGGRRSGGTMGPNAFSGTSTTAGASLDRRLHCRTGVDAAPGLDAAGRPARDQVMSDAGRSRATTNRTGAIWGNDAAAFNAQARRRKDALRETTPCWPETRPTTGPPMTWAWHASRVHPTCTSATRGRRKGHGGADEQLRR